MSLGREVGLGPGDIVLDGDPAPPQKKRHSSPHFSAHVYYGQTAGWIKTPFDMEVGLSPGHIVLDRDPAPPHPETGTAAPSTFQPMFTAGYIKMPLGREVSLGDIVLDGDPAAPQKGNSSTSPTFRLMSIVAKRLDGSKCHLVRM